MEAETFIPNEFYCPITGDLMNNPMSEQTGHSYERESIMRWLTTKQTSPMTNLPLIASDLTENLALKRSIDSIRDKINSDQMKIKSQISDVELKSFIDVLSDIEVKTYYMDDKLFVNVKTPDVEVRPPIDVVLCIDISGSMATEATIKGDGNERISHGLSILSLTVNAAKTVLRSLNENDNISIVTYSNEATIIVDYLSCTSENKVVIETQLDALAPTYTTNIWSGIDTSFNILKDKSPQNRMKGVLLLTDGIPNVVPPRGHEGMIQKYIRDTGFKCGISSYGFGYQLDSELLMNISSLTGGDGYSFIPDASLLGNVFIHGISNMLSTAANYSMINIKLEKNVKFADGLIEMNFEIDSLKYGSEKNFIFDLDTRDCPSRSLDHFVDCANVTLTVGGKEFNVDRIELPPPNYFNEQIIRKKMINLIINSIRKAQFNDRSFEDEISAMVGEIESSQSEYIKNMLFDLNGQIKESLNMTVIGSREDWFNRWGIHYLRSLVNAYQNEICNNFKDKGVSNFGNGLFERLRDEISDIFDDIPPPKVIHSQPVMRGGTRGGVMRGCSIGPVSVPLVSMSTYNTASGGCCASGCKIMMENKTYQNVEEIKKGDKILTMDCENISSVSEIECVIKTKCKDDKMDMVVLNNLKITPYHPIKIINMNGVGEWEYPIDSKKVETVKTDYMYTFVIENRQSVMIDDYVFSTYGHSLNDNDVIFHEYFGSDRIINDLKSFEGYSNGIVELCEDSFVRDDNTNQVVAIKM